VLTRQQCRDIRRLHREFRNNFVHFIPTGWGIEKVGLPRIIGAALDVVEDLMNRRQVTYRMEEHTAHCEARLGPTARVAMAKATTKLNAQDRVMPFCAATGRAEEPHCEGNIPET